MFRIDRIDTNELSGITDLELTIKVYGREAFTYKGSYMKRSSAVAMVRSSVLQYFQNSIERFMLTCFWACEYSETDHWNTRRSKALDICSRYHEWLFNPEAEYPESLQYYLRISSEFRNMLPGKRNKRFDSLNNQLITFEELAAEFYLEFTKNGHLQMSQYEQKTIARAS